MYHDAFRELAMRHLTAFVVCVFAWGATGAAAPMTALERQRLVSHMDVTERSLMDELSDLSPAQLAFRPAPNSWTILEVLDHLVVVGPIYWKDLRSAQPAPAGRVGWMTDADVLWYGIDRTNREAAVSNEEPTKRLTDLQSGLAAYRKQHTQLLEYIRTTTDDLRGRFVQRQGCDAYQWALLISAHEQRHILQIREIKANPKYPKSAKP
jgi:DinB superfamily